MKVKMKRHKCIICGKRAYARDEVEKTPGLFIHGGRCSKILVARVQGYFTIGGFQKQDLVDNEHITQEEADQITEEQELDLARTYRDDMWNGVPDDLCGDVLTYTAQEWEKRKLLAMPKNMLPTMIGNLKFDDNESYLQELIKGPEDEKHKEKS